jgi:CubicO group peptidase (beta-lactamase class C family)
MLDIEAGKLVQPDSIFRIYSLTKPITALALLILLEEGKLRLDEPITKYFPTLRKMKVYQNNMAGRATFVEIEKAITIRHLLTHTSGLGYGFGIDDHPVEKLYQSAGFFNDILTLQVSLPEMMRMLGDLPLAFQPGAAWRYSIAYDVIGHLIEIISDSPLDIFLKTRLFEPLEMIDTAFFVPEEKRERFGSMYCGPDEGEIFEVDNSSDSPFLEPNNAQSGGGGLVSTISDYLNFLTLLGNGGQWGNVRLLSQELVKYMISNQLTPSQFPVRFGEAWPGMGYGLGVGVQIDHLPNEGWPFGTFGWLGFSGVGAWVFPKESAIFIAMPQATYYFEPGHTCRELVYETLRSW